MPRTRLSPIEFTVGWSATREGAPERFVPAVVPGAVQLDWARAEGYPEYWKADNFRAFAWMEDVFWRYRGELPRAPVGAGARRVLTLRGVDYQFEVRVGGALVHEQEGMFAPAEIDVTGAAPGAAIEILVFPTPKYPHAHRPKAQASRSCKPAVSYGWDWHPRLIPLGIWDEIFVEDRPAAHLHRGAFDLSYTLAADYSAAAARARIVLAGGAFDGSLAWRLTDPDGRVVDTVTAPARAGTTTLEFNVAAPRLWWPNGQGEAALYRSTFELRDAAGTVIDEHALRHGFRSVRLVMNDGAWEEPSTFPKGRSDPPITLEVNGRRIFAKGSNWVNPEIFPGTISAETYAPLVQLAKDAHFNIFRVWGGGIVNKEAFFEECDEAGIMVWQEFPLACNDYADDPDYLRVLDRESRAIIARVRQHPSLAMWCGGNELFNIWSGMTDQHHALRLLDRNCFDLDRNTPYLPTSPVSGMGHGDYRFRDDRGREVYRMFAEARNSAYTEFGCPGPSDAEYIAAFTPKDELFPPRRGTAWETHHAFEAWGVAPESWLFPSLIAEYFGEPADLGELVRWGQLMQAEGYKCLFEEARRQKPQASMALNWCYNEPWPSAANNSLINWPHRPKPAYHAVAAACRPALASAKLPRFSWQERDLFSADLWILNDQPEAIPAGRLHAALVLPGGEIPLLSWDFPALPANQNLAGPIARVTLPSIAEKTFTLKLRVEGRPAMDSAYTLCFKPGVAKQRARVGFNNNQ